MAISENGAKAVVVFQDACIVYDWKPSDIEIDFPYSCQNTIKNVALSCDGGCMAIVFNSKCILWNLGDQTAKTFDHGALITSLALDPKGTTLITGSSLTNSIKVWNVVNNTMVKKLHNGGSEVHTIALSPCGTMIAIGGNKGLALYCLVRNISIPVVHSGTIRSVAFNTKGTHLVSGGDDKKARVLQMPNCARIDLLINKSRQTSEQFELLSLFNTLADYINLKRSDKQVVKGKALTCDLLELNEEQKKVFESFPKEMQQMLQPLIK